MVDEGLKAKIDEMDGRQPYQLEPRPSLGVSHSGFRPTGVVDAATGLPVRPHLIRPVDQIILFGEPAG